MKLPEPTEIIDMAGNSHLVYTEAQCKQAVRDALEAAAQKLESPAALCLRSDVIAIVRNMAKEIV